MSSLIGRLVTVTGPVVTVGTGTGTTTIQVFCSKIINDLLDLKETSSLKKRRVP